MVGQAVEKVGIELPVVETGRAVTDNGTIEGVRVERVRRSGKSGWAQ
jgi:hypothetical protein